jgi:hypothetical protein
VHGALSYIVAAGSPATHAPGGTCKEVPVSDMGWLVRTFFAPPQVAVPRSQSGPLGAIGGKHAADDRLSPNLVAITV